MAANLLWAHLLRKDATTTDTPSQIPAIAPQDKTGTSMRMLIHDTQVNLEKFSTRLDGLLQRVDDCRAEVVNANKLLDVERDKVLTEILEIANKCQSEMKAHVGAPAQATALDLVHVSQVSTERSVQALEKRIDALQALLQAHATAMQSIQDQQNTLIGAVVPLVPILHGVSPQMDQIKAALSDMVTNAVSTITENVRSMLVSEFAQNHGCARSSATRVGSSSKSTSSSRHKRPNASSLGPKEINIFPSSPLDHRSHEEPRLNLKRARIEEATEQEENIPFSRKLSRLTEPSTNPGDRTAILRTPQTPRQPLADLPLPSGSNTSRVRNPMPKHMASTFREYMRTLETRWATGGSSNAISTSRPSFQHHERARQHLQDMVPRRHSAAHDELPVADKSSMTLPSAAGPSNQDVLSKTTKDKEIQEASPSGVISIHSSPLSSPPPSAPRTMYPRSKMQENMADLPRVEPDPITSNPEASPPKSMSLRDRRAQMSRFGRTETRRFIPMVPWSDEEE